MSLFDQLGFSGIGIGPVQSEDEMTVIPIVGSTRGDVARPQNLQFQRTTSYGTMVFENKDNDHEAIIPSNFMVRGRGAQDHAMAGSGVVRKGQSRSFTNACCVEESQGGLLRGAEKQDVLPVELRKVLLDTSIRSEDRYSKLWGKISGWLRGLNVGSGGRAHIGDFYDTPAIGDALENFAAAFEPVQNQIGAVIMFNGVPVGIEIMPSAEHWEVYWKYLIRGCYGAELVRLKMLGKIRPSALVLPNIPEGSDDNKVEEIMDSFASHIQQELLPLLEGIQIKSQTSLDQTGSMRTILLRTDSDGGGDLVQQGDEPVYLSLVL